MEWEQQVLKLQHALDAKEHYVIELKRKINALVAEKNDAVDRYNKVRESAVACGSACAIINHLEHCLENEKKNVEAYRERFKKYEHVFAQHDDKEKAP